MKALIFNGALERRSESTSNKLSGYLAMQFSNAGIDSHIFNLNDSGIPLFDVTLNKVPKAVEIMSHHFLEADVHIWLAPLYHGSIPGVMKNCLDWLETTSKFTQPYLSGKTVGMICWADGVQAMQGINTMDSIAKSLRAWPLPYSIPIVRPELFDKDGNLSEKYKYRLKLMMDILLKGPNKLHDSVI